MCKEMRALKMAAKAAEQSGHDIFRHGAVLIKGGSILNISANSDNHTAFGQRFRTEPGRATHHAETACPCSMCHEVMRFVGVKKVVYTIGPDEWGSYKVSGEAQVGYEDSTD